MAPIQLSKKEFGHMLLRLSTMTLPITVTIHNLLPIVELVQK